MLGLYGLKNVSENGYMPVEKLSKIRDYYYDKRTVGVTRMYAAFGADRRIDALVRIHGVQKSEVMDGLYVIIEGVQYRIDAHKDIVGTDDVDLTLVRLEDYYDLAESEA